jgi:hypothetical protein
VQRLLSPVGESTLCSYAKLIAFFACLAVGLSLDFYSLFTPSHYFFDAALTSFLF